MKLEFEKLHLQEKEEGTTKTRKEIRQALNKE